MKFRKFLAPLAFALGLSGAVAASAQTLTMAHLMPAQIRQNSQQDL